MWIVFVLVQPRSLSVADSSEEVAIDLLLGGGTAHSILFCEFDRKQSTEYQFFRSLSQKPECRRSRQRVKLRKTEYDKLPRR
jgi:hypothetical protein